MHGHLQIQYMSSLFCWMTSGQSALCNLSLHCALLSPCILSVTAEWEEQRCWRRGAPLSKSAFCEIVGGPWKYLNLWKQKRLFFSKTFLLLTLYKALYCLLLFLSSHGPRSVKPMPFTTTTITTSTTPMSLATRQPHTSGNNLCKHIIKETLDLPHTLYYSIHLYSTTSASSSSHVVLYTNMRLRQPLVHIHLNAHHNANHTEIQHPLLFTSIFFMFKQCLTQVLKFGGDKNCK